jgi:hypothetical protein
MMKIAPVGRVAMIMWTVLTVLLLTTPEGLAAGSDRPPVPIRDNSFLIEEAYNQEEGVVQHVFTFARGRDSRGSTFAFAQEWPLRGERHQLSFSVPLESPGDSAGGSGVGDATIDYRHQVLGGSEGKVSFSPRLSLLLPTGDETAGRGAGASGFQVNLPLSVELSRSFVTHANLGATLIPSASNDLGHEADTSGYHVGQSLVWLAHPAFNLMLEAKWSRWEEVTGPDGTSRRSNFILSPGVRAAFDLDSGLQIVPGVAVPLRVNGDGESALFVYLSFEHPFRPVPPGS